MKAPLLAVLKGSPITRVMEMLQPHLTWDAEEPGSPDDLWDLETGKEYGIKVRTPYTLKWCGQEYELKEGWNDGVLWRPWVAFSPGQFLTQTHWDWALSVLERTGHDRLLGTCDVQLIKVVSEAEMIRLVASPLRGTFYQAERAVLLMDVPPDPPNTVLAEMIAHEAITKLGLMKEAKDEQG